MTVQEYQKLQSDLTAAQQTKLQIDARGQALTEEYQAKDAECVQKLGVNLQGLPAKRQELQARLTAALQRFNTAVGKVRQYANPGA